MRLAEKLNARNAEGMTLLQLNRMVRSVLQDRMDGEYWVTGELSDATAGYGGHFYGELIQKDESGQSIVARARVNCWARTYNLLRLRFESETGQTLRAGMQVRLLVHVTFHEQYGYSLNIQDVDSTFTLGDMARRRREILAQLEADGILHDNQELSLPRLLIRVAVVSARTAAGYGDFCDQLLHNEYGFHFTTRLFPAVMQGQHVEESVIEALQQIADEPELWDVVVIIRGGGATGDLSDFDSYPLAACIAQYPLPVIVGIGHDRDETVLDFVAHTRVKTPTAAAAFLIDHQAGEAALLDELYQRITVSARERLLREQQNLKHHSAILPLLFTGFTERQRSTLQLLSQRMSSSFRQWMQAEKHRLQMMEQRLAGLDPRMMLKRGYSITTCNGCIVRSPDDVQQGANITTIIEQGEILSNVISCKKN